MNQGGQDQENNADSYKTTCTLVVPGLLSLPQGFDENPEGSSPKFSELELFLARAVCKEGNNTDFESTIFSYFDISVSPENEFPIAPVSYLGDTGNTSSQWIVRADPVYLMPSRDELVLNGPENLSLTMSEAEHMVAVLNDFFKEDGWRIEAATPERWYLHVPKRPGIHTHTISIMQNRAIGDFLPNGVEGGRWRRAMNEVQMLLHRNNVNIQRESENKLPVNSVWFWGEGDLPGYSHSRWSQLWSSEPISLGLARLTRTPRGELPMSSHDWLSSIDSPGDHLFVFDQLQSQKLRNDEAWEFSLNDFQENWLKPMMQAMQDKAIDQLTLDPCSGKTYRLSTSVLKRWWRRKKPMHTYCT